MVMKMKKLFKKVVMPIFLSVLCGFISGKLVFSIYEEKTDNTLSSSIIYLLEDSSYDDYNTMKASTLSSDYIYYEEDGKYKTVIGMTKKKENIEKIRKVYDKDVKIEEYLLNDSDINSKLEELDEKILNSNSDNEIKDLVVEMLNIYKERDDVKMAKIS